MLMRHNIYNALRILRLSATTPFAELTLLHARALRTGSMLTRKPYSSLLSSSALSTSSKERYPGPVPTMEQSDTTTTHPTPAQDPTKTTIDIPIDDRGTLSKRDLVMSSAVKQPSSLITGLLQLLSHAKQPMQSEDRDPTACWTLESSGDAISRTLAFGSQDQARLFCEKLSAVSDEMDHHAHVSSEGADASLPTGNLTRVRVTCTTHRPRGLSMRDVRLARRVDELADAL